MLVTSDQSTERYNLGQIWGAKNLERNLSSKPAAPSIEVRSDLKVYTMNKVRLTNKRKYGPKRYDYYG